MSVDGRPDAALRLPSRYALFTGLVLAGLVLAAVLWLGWYAHAQVLEADEQRGVLLSRMLEDQATRSFETASLALVALADVAATQTDLAASPSLRTVVNQALVGLPFLRSVAVLDAQGRVLMTSNARDSGVQIDLARLGPMPNLGRDAIGPRLPGRGLADLQAPTTAAGVAFIPLLRPFSAQNGGPLLLVALVNPDVFTLGQRTALGDQAGLALLVSYDGNPLAGSGDDEIDLARLRAHPVFGDGLRGRPHGRYVGQGVRAERALVAFRASASRPLMVLVEQPYAATVSRWMEGMRWFVMTGVAASLFLVAMAWLARRSLRLREASRLQLDQAQAQIAHSERELRVLVKSLQELVFRTDAQGVITFVNERWAVVMGGPSSDALGKHLAELVPPAQASLAASLFDRHAPAGVRTTPITIAARNGVMHRFDVAVVPLRGAQGIVGFAGSAVDVTERWVAEQQLQSQLALTGLLLEISPVPIAMSDAAGCLVSVNQAWEEFFGRTRDEVIGTPEHHFMHVEGQPLHERTTVQGARGGRERLEARLTHRDGSQRDMVITREAVTPAEGQAIGTLSTLMDVSEFREAERATREARDAAEEASRTKSEFVANISHELRTPLQSIIGFSELGTMRAREHERLGEMFRDIHSAGQRMLALVNDLLDVAKIESTVGTFHLERLDLRGPVRSVLRELAPLLLKRNLHVELALSEAPLTAKADPLRFQQALRNVLANAIKFSPAGQTIDVRGEALPSGTIQISVRDRGPGIPPGELHAIFEAFVQSSQTKDGSGGTGLGLAITRKIIEAHGGRIHAENASGGGAMFQITVPSRGFADTLPMEA